MFIDLLDQALINQHPIHSITPRLLHRPTLPLKLKYFIFVNLHQVHRINKCIFVANQHQLYIFYEGEHVLLVFYAKFGELDSLLDWGIA